MLVGYKGIYALPHLNKEWFYLWMKNNVTCTFSVARRTTIASKEVQPDRQPVSGLALYPSRLSTRLGEEDGTSSKTSVWYYGFIWDEHAVFIPWFHSHIKDKSTFKNKIFIEIQIISHWYLILYTPSGWEQNFQTHFMFLRTWQKAHMISAIPEDIVNPKSRRSWPAQGSEAEKQSHHYLTLLLWITVTRSCYPRPTCWEGVQ